MVRYLVLLNFTEKGLAGVKESPARAEAFRAAAARAGATIETQLWTLGPYDGAFVLSAPDETTSAALVLELAQSSKVKTTMLRAFDADEFGSVADKLS